MIPFEFAVYTRWSWALLPPWYTDSVVSRLLHALSSPVKAAAWKLFEVLFPLHTATPGMMFISHLGLDSLQEYVQLQPLPITVSIPTDRRIIDLDNKYGFATLSCVLWTHEHYEISYSEYCLCFAGPLKHPHSLLAGIFDTIGILHAPAVRHAFTSGALQGVQGEVATLDQDGVLLTDGRSIKVTQEICYVLCVTG